MKRKRLTKSEKKVIEALVDDQISTLNSLRNRVESMKKKIDDLASKMSTEGINTNYSSSSDIMKVAQDIYALELRLSRLKIMQTDMEYTFRKSK